MGIHLTNYRIYKENKDLYWWLFDLWENKDHNIKRTTWQCLFSIQMNKQTSDNLKINFTLLYSKGKDLKKNGACVFWAPVFF